MIEPEAISQVVTHMRIGVAWPDDLDTVQRLISQLNHLEIQHKLLLRECDRLKDRLSDLWSDGNPLTTAEE